MKRHNSRGFTLLELLIVIIVIAILAGILLPAFAKTRELARRKKKESDIQTLELAIRNYRFEANEWPVPDQSAIDPNNPLEFTDDNGEVVSIMMNYQGGAITFLKLGDYNTDSRTNILDPWGTPYRFKFWADPSTNNNPFQRMDIVVEAQ